MNDRQAFAHAHPIARADGVVDAFTARKAVQGAVLTSILTVNR